MLHILQLFGRSPFAPLQSHMEKVNECVHQLQDLFKTLLENNLMELQKVASKISDLEHQADIIKNDIRNHLPSSLFLPIERAIFLEMLTHQDSLADSAEDVAVLMSLRQMLLMPPFQERYLAFLSKNIECFDVACRIIQELHELVESSFGGAEAEKVKVMCDKVFFLEHEADVLQRTLLQSLFEAESEMSYGVFFQWQKVFESTGDLANISEKLANCVRTTLDIKKK